MSTSPPTRTNPLPRADRSVRGQPPPTGSNTLVLVAVCAVLVLQVISLWRATPGLSAPGATDTMQTAIIDQMKELYDGHATEIKTLEQRLSNAIDTVKTSVSELASKLTFDLEDANQDRIALGKSLEEKTETAHVEFDRKLAAVTDSLDGLHRHFETLSRDFCPMVSEIRKSHEAIEKSVKESRGVLDKIQDNLSDEAKQSEQKP